MKPSSKLCVLSVLAIFAAIFTSQVQAILDQNNNGISDLWEKQHNNGNLFPTTFLATNDEDFDGWTNGKEAIAGTDPFEANPPDGIVDVIITPSLVNGAFTLAWPTLIGKNYQLQFSTDLLNWSNLGEPVTTNQSTHSIGISNPSNNPLPPRVFWQVAVTDLDTDLDGLTNSEEHQLGTNPTNPHSDGDTLNDKAEILANTNPLDEDTDEDGINDNLDATPLQNNALADPDGANLAAHLNNSLTETNGVKLLARYDFQTLPYGASGGFPSTISGQLAASATNVGWDIFENPSGMPSFTCRWNSAPAANEYLRLPYQILDNKTKHAWSYWLKLPKNAFVASAQNTGIRSLLSIGFNQYAASYPGTSSPLPAIHWYCDIAAGTIRAETYQVQIGTPAMLGSGWTIPSAWNDGEWHHIVLSKNETKYNIYFDGIELGERSSNNIDLPLTSNSYTIIGRRDLTATTATNATYRFPAGARLDRLRCYTKLAEADILALYNQDIDNDGLYDRTESRVRYWNDLNQNALREATESDYILRPFHHDEPTSDHDGDKITSLAEQNTHFTHPGIADSDGDLIPDYWELSHGLNPLTANDANLDPDNDGLSNINEYRHNTHPQLPNTDGDSKNDGQEAKGPDGDLDTDDGSNPNDHIDNGIRPPSDQLLTLKLGVGDRSVSHSEDYVLHVFQLQPDGSEKRIYTLRSGGFGQYSEQNRSFPKAHTYSFQIDWQGTNNNAQSPGSANAEGADFDYHFVVTPLSGNQSHILIDSYDPRTKTADPTTPLLDPEDINPSDDNNDDVRQFLTTHEPKRVVLLNMPIQSRDRLIEGNINDCQLLFDSYDLTYSSLTENLGSYSFGSGNTSAYIYTTLNAIFSDDEFAMVNSPSPDTNDPRIADQTIFYRDDQYPLQVKWFTALNTLSEFKITLSHRGVALGQSKHTPTAESNFSGLMDHLAIRTNSADMPALAAITEPSTEIGNDDEEEDPPPAASPPPPSPDPAPVPPVAPTMTGTSRNLWAKVCFISNYAWEQTKHETIKNLKIGGGFIKGLSDGLCDGFKYDIEGVQELGLMLGESLQGNHARAKQLWDGVKLLATMPSAQRAVMFDNMLQSFMEKAQTQVPWDASANNVTDDWGVAAYMSGYGGGFIVEQVIMIYVTAGVGKGLMWLGNGVKNAINATRAGVIIGQAISATQKFVVGAFLSVTKHVVNLGEEGIRSAQAIMRHLAQKTYLGLQAADITHEVITRLTPVKMTYQLFADMVSPHCTTVAKWMQYGYGCYKRMCEICTIGRLVLNESAMRGFARLYPALRSPTNASADFAEHLLNACRPTATAPVDPFKLNALLEICDDTTAGYKFLPDPSDITKIRNSVPGGLVYNHGSQQGHRFIHVLEHCKENPLRAAAGKPHGVFDTPVEQLHTYLDDVWRNRGNYVVSVQNQGAKKVVEVTLPTNVGQADNIAGSSARSANGYVNTRTIKFVVTEDNNVYTLVTAYPITP